MQPHTLGDIALLLRSFESDGDAFYFVGYSTLPAIDHRLDQLRRGIVPVVRLAPAPQLQPSTAVPPPPPIPLPTPPPLSEMPPEHRPIVCFDTETTGLSPAIVCQLAYVVVENGVTTEFDQLLKLPRGAAIGRQAQSIHGISNRECAKRGVDAVYALETFARTCARILAAGGRIVAHNSRFDCRALQQTRDAHNIIDYDDNETLAFTDTFCTMANSKQYSNLNDKAGRQKAFKNDELFTFLYGHPPTFARLHNALDDVRVTVRSYVAGLRRGWW